MQPGAKDLDDLQIQEEARLDSSRSTVWLLNAKRDGSFSKAVCVDALEELDFRLWDLSVDEKKSAKRSVTFYLQPTDKLLDANRPQDSVLLFCIFMDPRKKKMKYLGSITVATDSSLHSVCFDVICSLDNRMRDIDCSFFVVHPDDRIAQIRRLQKTVNEVRLGP